MIKSRILANESTRGINWIVIYFLVLIVAFVRSLLLSQAYASPLEIAIWYPVVAICGFFTAIYAVNLIGRNWTEINEKKLYSAMLLAIGGGFLCSFIPFWGQAAAGMPLTLMQIGGYFLTLGVYPLSAGPDGLLRGLAWGMAVAIGWLMYKDKQSLINIVQVVLASWIGMSLILILPSFILMATFAVKGLPMAWSNTDLVSEFTRVNLFSYWADGQLLRWFTGFGNQTVNALLLYTGSVVFVCGTIFWSLSNRSMIGKILSGVKIYDLLPLLLIVLYGYQAGLGRQGWVGIDWAAWLVFICVFIIAWMKVELFVSDTDSGESSLSVVGALGAMLLGWPVLLGYLIVIGAGYLIIEIKKIVAVDMMRAVGRSAILPFFALITALFVRRGLAFESSALKIIAAGFVFSWLYSLLIIVGDKAWSKIRVIAIWFVGLLLLWILAGVFAPAAIMMLAGVLLWLFWQKALADKRILFVLVWGTASAVLLLTIWLPRLAGPELIPL